MSIRLFRHHMQLPIVLLIAVEAGLSWFALYCASRWGPLIGPDPGRIPLWEFVLFTSILGLSNGAMGLYNVRLRERMSGIALPELFAAQRAAHDAAAL